MNCLQTAWSRKDFLKISCRHLYWYVFSKIFLRHLRVVFELSCLEEAILRCSKIILKRRLRIVTWNPILKLRTYKLRNNFFTCMSEIYKWKSRWIKTLTIPWVKQLLHALKYNKLSYHCTCRAAYYVIEIHLLSLRTLACSIERFP